MNLTASRYRWIAPLLAMLMGCSGDRVTPDGGGPTTADLPTLPEPVQRQGLPRGPERDPRHLTLALVGEVRGELEPCGCPTLPFGGFTRRSTLLKKLRDGTTLFHLDAGDLLVKGFATDRSVDLDRRATAALKMSEAVGVDVWVPGPSDLLAVPAHRMATVAGPRRVSATWADAAGELLLDPATVLERDGLRVGIIGLSGAPSDPALGVTGIDPVDATRAALKTLPPGLDLVVALGSVVDDEARRVAREVDGLSLVLTTRGKAYSNPILSTPETASSPAIIEAPDRGRYLQVVQIRLGSEPGQPVWLHPEASKWRARNAAMRRDPTTDSLAEEGRGRNLAYASTIPLGADLDREGPLRSMMDHYKARALTDAATRANDVGPHTPTYAASGACVNCHSSEFARWSLSGHARAWLALVESQQTTNPECLACHTTAWGEPTGLGELTDAAVRKFKGVQCEVCHGPLKGHPQDNRIAARPISEQTCLPCHDEANSPDFDYATYLPQASCQGGSPEVIPHP